MQLQNHTPFSAALFGGVIDEHRLFHSLAVRVTYELAAGRLVVAGKPGWPISPGPWKCQYGTMLPDELFYRGGVDLFVFGSARPPGGRPEPRVDVIAAVGSRWQCSVAVFGDRVWQERKGKLVPSEPRPFSDMPLTLENAFGGKDEWDELPIPCPDNPDGKGFYLSAENAAGRPLPNVESPDNLIAKWDDRPDPVGVGRCPAGFGPRLRESVDFDAKTGALTKFEPTVFNAAFPRMVVPQAAEGEEVRVRGVSTAGDVAFTLPPSQLRVRLGFGEKSGEYVPPIDQIAVEADQARVTITYRYPFRYVMRPLERRSCELFWDGKGAAL
jgi:hypothetical protein